ncbi:MAG: hypothetical protein JSW65_02635 [Candidatus Bipolaricaulota bacterium]|nr:MAG: hypothetical protein JSW65_02635 [Candidatus Bipolaricaulota bacterium]
MPLNSARIVLALLIALAASGSVVYAPPCPPGVIASDNEIISGALGVVSIDLCVTRDAGVDTYTYRLANLGPTTAQVCGFLVSGMGAFSTVSQTAPPGWAGDVAEADGSASWWRWSQEGVPAEEKGLAPGEAVVMSMSLAGPTSPTDGAASLGTCGREPVTLHILGPSACAVPEGGPPAASCDCGVGGCVGRPLFEGEGERIVLLRGPETLTVTSCDPTWVRHGFSGIAMAPDEVAFRLFVDGVPIPLEPVVHFLPSAIPGIVVTVMLWHAQFAAGTFSEGAHELVGEWDVLGPDGYLLVRPLTLIVEPCAEAALLPDLEVRVTGISCGCLWGAPGNYSCDLDVRVSVENLGSVPSPVSRIELHCPEGERSRPLFELAPGEVRRTTLSVSFDLEQYAEELPCPIPFQVVVDPADAVAESDEANNIVDGSSCCEDVGE